MLNCALCEKVFSDRRLLNSHMVSHTKEKTHKCPTCTAAFGLRGNLKSHIRTVHEGIKRVYKTIFKCPTCDYKSGIRAKIEAHSRRHSAERPFSCNKLGCSFNTKYVGGLRLHTRVAHGKKRSYKCPSEGCTYESKHSGGLKAHLKTHSTERPFLCTFPGCNKTCKRSSNLKDHIYRCHSSETPFKCSTCEFETKHKFRLRQHEDAHRNIKRFHCQFPNCNHASNHKIPMQLHYDSMHRKKNVICTVPGCNFRCGSIALLKTHVRIHLCPILKCPRDYCNFSTKTPKVLRKHLSCRHGEDQPVSLDLPSGSTVMTSGQALEWNQRICPFPNCNYHTDIPQRFDHHIKTHNAEKGKYTCKFCSMRFPTSRKLESHMQAHTGEKPYSCSYCGFTTAYALQLRNHASRNHDIYLNAHRHDSKEVKSCNLCNTICMSQSELVLHTMKHLQAVVVLQRLRIDLV